MLTFEQIKGENRIKMDRLWRSSEARKRFESETGTYGPGETSIDYQEAFNQWAYDQINKD